jgi:hypothetical protein
MSEKIPTVQPKEAMPTAEEIEREENERYEWWVANNPVVEVVQNAPESEAEKAAEAECEAMMDDFEKMFDLEALRAITQFFSKEERRSSIRQPALDALSTMFARMKELSRQGVLGREAREALGKRYEILSRAVGNLVADKDDDDHNILVHDRPTPFPGDRILF